VTTKLVGFVFVAVSLARAGLRSEVGRAVETAWKTPVADGINRGVKLAVRQGFELYERPSLTS
jgi:hypothetical protein